MNTIPDDVMLALWLDDELAGDEFAAVEAWAATRPGQLAAREDTRRYRRLMSATLPREEEPPYSDFFNSRIQAAICATRVADNEPVRKARGWRPIWFLPTAAAAGVVLGFLGGLNVTRATHGPPVAAASPLVYTPDNEVKANYFAGKNGSSTVIVLEGVSAIPDSTDFRATASLTLPGEIDSTASAVEDATPSEN